MKMLRVRWLIALLILLAVAGWAYKRFSVTAVFAYTVNQAPLVQQVVATGRVVPVSTARIGTEITGVVDHVRVDEGDSVNSGDILLQLRPDELAARVRESQAALELLELARRPQALARLRQAQAQLEQAQREAKRRRQLIAANAVPRETLEQAEQALATAQATADQARLEVDSLASGSTEELILSQRLEQARAALNKATLRAPTAGHVLRRRVEPGDLVQPGATLLEIASSSQGVEILVPVDERNLSVLALGQTAVSIADAYPQSAFNAQVTEIAPAVDPQRGTVDVRLRVQSAVDFLRADMTVTVTITTGQREQALIVPNQALFDQQGESASVWLLNDGSARQAQVQAGLRGTAFTEVTQGLVAGDVVALQAGLRSGERVQPVHSTQPDTSVRRETPMKFN